MCDQHITRTAKQKGMNLTPMPRVGFEPTIPVFELSKTIRARLCGHWDWLNLSLFLKLRSGRNQNIRTANESFENVVTFQILGDDTNKSE
jgi:hypothetical protein